MDGSPRPFESFHPVINDSSSIEVPCLHVGFAKDATECIVVVAQ